MATEQKLTKDDKFTIAVKGYEGSTSLVMFDEVLEGLTKRDDRHIQGIRCDLCGKMFYSRLANFRKHMEKAHGVKNDTAAKIAEHGLGWLLVRPTAKAIITNGRER